MKTAQRWRRGPAGFGFRSFARCWLCFALTACGADGIPSPVEPLTPTRDAPFRAKPPKLVEATAVPLPQLYVSQLSNGLTLIVAPRDGLPLVALEYANKAAVDDPGQVGLAALTAAAISQQEPSSKESSFSPAMERGFLRISQRGTGTSLKATVLANEVESMVATLAEMLQRPRFSERSIERARRSLVKMAKDPWRNRWLTKAALELLYGVSHPATRSLRGEAQTLAAFPDSEVYRFHQQHYGPGQSSIIISGAVNPAEVQTLVEHHFGSWSTTTTPRPAPQQRETRTKDLAIRVFDNGQARGGFSLVAPCAPLGSPDAMPFELIALLLAGLSDAPTLHVLRHETAASYHVTANCWNQADGGRFEVNADVHPLKVGVSLREVLRQIERLRTVSVPEAELRSAKTALLARLAGLLASNEGMSHELAGAFLDGFPADYIPSLEAHILAISAEEVRDVAARYLSGFPGIAVHGPHVDMHTQLQGIGVLIWR